MSRTFSPITTPFIAGSKFGYQTAEKWRQAHDIAMYAGFNGDLGGDGIAGTTSTSFIDVNSRRVYTLNGDNFGGLTLEAVVTYRSGAAGTTVIAQVWNDTDSTAAATSATSTSTSLTDETLTLTMASGNKNYKLRYMSGGGSNDPVYAYGYLRLRAVPS